jgi:parallel beta-helix repeat protein
MQKVAIIFLAAALFCFSAQAATFYVPSQYTTIQAGVNAASSTDTVVVAAGTYYEHVVISQSLSLLGEDMYTTIIDASGSDRPITVNPAQGTTGQISGFTLTNSGQGVSGSFACAGLVIYSQGTGNWLVSWNYFKDNPDNGYLAFDGGTVTRNIFENNSYAGSYRRTLFVSSSSNLTVTNNDFRDNYRAVYVHPAANSIVLENNIITNNTYGIDMNIAAYTLLYNDVWSNTYNYTGCSAGTGDISVDPQYVGGIPFDYHLTVTSLCINAGNPASPLDPDGSIADQGVYFYYRDPPAMVVDLTYRSGSPVSAAGGNLYFDVYVENTGTTAANFDAWLQTRYEGGPPVTLVQRSFTNYLPGWSINRPNMFYPIPGTWQAGNYVMQGLVGIHPVYAFAMDSFPFSKLGHHDGSSFVPWAVAGAPNPFGEITKTVSTVPAEFTMLSAYPNPFNPITTLEFGLQEEGHVSLIVYDLSGREVATLFNDWYPAGQHEAVFAAYDLPSGVYFARLINGNHEQTRKLMLMK